MSGSGLDPLYKVCRPKEIAQSNLMVQEVVKVLEETFFNPFLDDLNKSQLYNTVSGKLSPQKLKTA